MTRFKNYGLWLSIFAFIPMLLEAFGVKVLPANYSDLVTAFLGILVLAGILNNPTNGTGYLDAEPTPQPEQPQPEQPQQ